MNLFEAKKKGLEGSYIAPDPLFISAISLFSNSFPWKRFKTFFNSKKLLGLSADEQVTLLRFLAVQELLCLDDKALLSWLKHQFYLFNFLQPDFKPRLPTLELFQKFRAELDSIGLLLPFRKQCQHIIEEHGKRFPELNLQSKQQEDNVPPDYPKNYSGPMLSDVNPRKNQRETDKKVDLHPVHSRTDISCENCGSQNIVRLKSTQEASSLPDIRFMKCRFCGHTFRAR